MAASQSALIFGATGQTGRLLLQELLRSPEYSRVGEYGRRVTPADKITIGKEKLEQKEIDFEKLQEAELGKGQWDVIYIALGTTAKIAGSAANFEKIDRDYVIEAAKHAKIADRSQRLVYLSSHLANPSSSLLYPRCKGQTEDGLTHLGYDDTIIFRPALLKGAKREHFRLAEELYGKVTGILSHFSPNVEIQISTLAKAMSLAGTVGSSSLPAAQASVVEKDGQKFTVISNSGAIALAKEASE